MDFKEYKSFVSEISVGKLLPDAIYVHESAIDHIPEKLRTVTVKIADALKIPNDTWNIIKYYKRDFKLALLHYPGFDEDSYPSLSTSYTVDLAKLSMRKADYSTSDNPPILHRKETFVGSDYPLRKTFCDITAEGEALGLYENTRKIGFKKNWERLIASKRCYLDSKGRIHKLAEASTSNGAATEYVEVERHKTAIDRNYLSQPMQVLARHNYLDGNYSVLDYGCGKGDDVRELEAHGIDVSGWDPIHNSEAPLVNSDIVNLGFVLNVIEDRDERDETLKRAWEYADKLLIVAVMIAGESTISQFTPYKDGVITSRKTFQRYYGHSEFREYLESIIDQNAIAASPGIFILFKDKLEEQTFLLERQHIRRDWRQLTERQRIGASQEITEEILAKHEHLFNDFGDLTLHLGRIPANNEFEFSEELRRIAGSHNKALRALLKVNGGVCQQRCRVH